MKRILDEIDSVHGTARLVETDNGPVFAEYCVEISGSTWELTRWYAPDEFDQTEALQFSAKVLNNPTYREACLNGSTNWATTQQLFETVQSKIVEIFENSGVLSFQPSDFQGEKQAEWASMKLHEIFREIYYTIRTVICDFGLDSAQLDQYLEAYYEVASALTTVFDSKETVNIENLRPTDQFLVFQPDDEPRWEGESLELSFPTIVDVYPEEYGPVVAISLPPQLNDIIKKLDWQETHRRWHSEREVWEVDLEATEQFIDIFTRHDYQVKAARPLVEIIDISPSNWPPAIRPNHHRPLMKQHTYVKLPSGTDLLRLPGVGSSRARWLLQHEFGSLPELAHSSVEAIAEVPNIRSAVAQTITEGAQIALGEIQHPSVTIVQQTNLLISDAERQIAKLASKGIPPTEAAEFIIETHDSPLTEIDAIDIIVLYHLIEEGITTRDAVESLSIEELTDIKYVTDTQAEDIFKEVSDK